MHICFSEAVLHRIHPYYIMYGANDTFVSRIHVRDWLISDQSWIEKIISSDRCYESRGVSHFDNNISSIVAFITVLSFLSPLRMLTVGSKREMCLESNTYFCTKITQQNVTGQYFFQTYIYGVVEVSKVKLEIVLEGSRLRWCPEDLLMRVDQRRLSIQSLTWSARAINRGKYYKYNRPVHTYLLGSMRKPTFLLLYIHSTPSAFLRCFIVYITRSAISIFSLFLTATPNSIPLPL